MNLQRRGFVNASTPASSRLLPEAAADVASLALAETRLRGLPAAEEYRVIADRLYRAGIRDVPPGILLEWIEETVAAEYERLLALRSLGDRVNTALARGDVAGAAWLLVCELPPDARDRLIEGAVRLNDLEAESNRA